MLKNFYPLTGIIYKRLLTKIPKGYKIYSINRISEFVKQNRKALGLTQEEFAVRSGLGLRFVRELEQGKKTV